MRAPWLRSPRRADPAPAEFTLKAVATGVVLGIVFGAANAYLGLRVGMTVSASIPAAVMTVAAFRLFRSGGTILEANLSQTVASASTSLATGTIFTIPALFLWGMVPPYPQVVALAFLGALLGLSAMIPLRRLLIVNAHDELPYPEGTACAEVLRATSGEAEGAARVERLDLPRHGRGRRREAADLARAPRSRASCTRRCRCCRRPSSRSRWRRRCSAWATSSATGSRPCASRARSSPRVTLTPLIAWLGAGLQAPLYPETQKLVADMDAGDDLVALRALRRRRRRRRRGDPHRAARPADDGGRLRRGGARPARRRRAARPRPASAPTATCPPGSCSAASRRSCSWRASSPASSRATWRRCSARCSRPASASSACCSSPWPRASSGSSASRRSRPRASRS